MIGKIKNFLRRKTKLKKAEVREHVSEFKIGNRGRVYANANGEKFILRREKRIGFTRGQFEHGRFEHISVRMERQGNEKEFATGTFFIDNKRNIITIDRINTFGITKKGYGVVDVMLDEAKQIAVKKFSGKTFQIQIIPGNEKLDKYYKSKGFTESPQDSDILQMTMGKTK